MTANEKSLLAVLGVLTVFWLVQESQRKDARAIVRDAQEALKPLARPVHLPS